jgi:hypothetical protein
MMMISAESTKCEWVMHHHSPTLPTDTSPLVGSHKVNSSLLSENNFKKAVDISKTITENLYMVLFRTTDKGILI